MSAIVDRLVERSMCVLETRSSAAIQFRRRMKDLERRYAAEDGSQHPEFLKYKGKIGDDKERDFDPNVGGGVDRDKLPDSDFAGPHRSFPIKSQADVSDALMSLGRAKGDKDAIRARIIAIAKRKGFSLPDSAKGEREARPWGESAGARSASRISDVFIRNAAIGEVGQVGPKARWRA